MKYIVNNASMSANKSVQVGDTVYEHLGHDYGCSRDDTMYTGIEHISVTLNEDGDYPFFTIPKAHLNEVG